ncbi:hypothetical protein JOF56_008634 [Kibdelosporangium banguiense]|uniref:Uncharacterized protein n=1 Tax=Kibdelosporangium banguiense TaxID=1365924 RepID=A0ABS4TV09_9PSEU|nr:hypothetical protein [Kibdelosporangium banguiense]
MGRLWRQRAGCQCVRAEHRTAQGLPRVPQRPEHRPVRRGAGGLSKDYSFAKALRPFVTWKRGVLNRLQLDREVPHFQDYSHLPEFDVIESAIASPG